MHNSAVGQDRAERPTSKLIGEARQEISRLKSDLETRRHAAEETERALVELRRRLAQAERELARCSYEAGETASDLDAAREELRRTVGARDEAEKISVGLKEHVGLLMEDVREWHAAFAAVQQARVAQAAETDRTLAALARQVKQVLAALDTSRLDLAFRLSEAENARVRQTAELEIRLQRQADEIETLRQVVETKQRAAEHERSEAERLRQAAAGAVGRAAGLINGHGAPSVWKPLRLRRQAAVLRDSGIFDAEWYLREYTDVAKAGIDPLRHYVEFGAKEGRAPNPTLAHAPATAETNAPAGLAPLTANAGPRQG